MKIIKPTKNGKDVLSYELELFHCAQLWGKKVRTYEMLGIIYQSVCLRDKFNNGKRKKGESWLTKCHFE